ncbi:ABC transporter substrate-binding protein [Rhodococcus qingshengii]|uniref:ABC transporter substrate-binding protein n=1 Tax=Rhodococcus qingshengii TaxID=334542 RepID=UPI001AE0CD80|nr:extracellular solute-binding protein [Rhodococcus qingshengii]
MKNLKPLTGVFLTAALTAAALTACSAGTGSSDPNKITVYSTMIPAVQARLAEAFQAETGIAVESVRIQSSQLTKRFDEEYKANRPVADVLTMNEELYALDAAKTDMFADIADLPGVASIPSDWKLNDFTFIPSLAPNKVAYSKAKVPAELVPTSWRDLLKPEFKGQILNPDPRTNPELSCKLLHGLVLQEGESFLSDLAAQDLRIVSSSTPGMEDLAGGNGMLLDQSYDMNLLAYEDKGSPIGLSEAFDPVVGLEFFTQIPANAPNADGARKWIEFLTSEKGQTLANQGVGASPLGAAIPGSLTMPGTRVSVDPQEALDACPRYLDLLGIE